LLVVVESEIMDFVVMFYQPSPSGDILRQQVVKASNHDAAASQVKKANQGAEVVAVLRSMRGTGKAMVENYA